MPVRFDVGFSGDSSFRLGFSGGESFGVGFGSVTSSGTSRPWTGEYEATPAWGEQLFATNGYGMTDDFTVHSIVKQEAPNQAGGLTLSI